MRYPIKPTVLTALLASTAFLGACKSQQRTDEITQSEQLIVLEEIGLESSLSNLSTPVFYQTTGPSLIAGDWLAIQCAQAGGYFNNYDWAPVYANVVTTDFE